MFQNPSLLTLPFLSSKRCLGFEDAFGTDTAGGLEYPLLSGAEAVCLPLQALSPADGRSPSFLSLQNLGYSYSILVPMFLIFAKSK